MAAEAKEADNGDDVVVDKDDSKQAKLKPNRSTHHSKKDSSKRIEPLNDNLDEYFGPSQSQNSQETAGITPVNTPKKSEKAKLKNGPDGSSRRRVDKLPKSSSKQPAQDPDGSGHRKVPKLPRGSTGEGLSEPSSKLKQSA